MSQAALSGEDRADLKTWVGVAGAVLGALMAIVNIQITNAARLENMKHYFMSHGVSDVNAAARQAVVAMGRIIRGQATLMGFADTFALLGVVLLLAAVTIIFLRKGEAASDGTH